MNHQPVKSSHITSVGYENGTLQVRFSNGALYQYAGVPPRVHQQFMAAPSPGTWFHDNIVGQFQHEVVTPPKPRAGKR